MPVDEAQADALIQQLKLKEVELRKKLHGVSTVKASLEGIKKVPERYTDENNQLQTRMIEPQDRALNKPMTPARKQEIYDACVAEANKVLSA